MDARRQKRLGPAPIASFEKSFEDNTTTKKQQQQQQQQSPNANANASEAPSITGALASSSSSSSSSTSTVSSATCSANASIVAKQRPPPLKTATATVTTTLVSSNEGGQPLPIVAIGAGAAGGAAVSAAGGAARYRGTATLTTPSTPRIELSRASSSSHHEEDSRESSPENVFEQVGTGTLQETIGLGFREEGALELRSSTEELFFMDPEQKKEEQERLQQQQQQAKRTSPHIFKFDEHQSYLQQHQRKDSASSEVAALLCISGRTSRISSVGSQGSAVSRLSAVSCVSRSPSPHRMLLETSFCGPKPVEGTADGAVSTGGSNASTAPSSAQSLGEATLAVEQLLLARTRHDPTQAVLAEGIQLQPPSTAARRNKPTSLANGNDSMPSTSTARPSAGVGVGGVMGAQRRSTKSPGQMVVGKTASGTEYIRINLRPDHMYSDKGIAANERVVEAPNQLAPVYSKSSQSQSKPASLSLQGSGLDENRLTPTASPKPSRHVMRLTSRSPSPAAPGLASVSRKSSFSSLFRLGKDSPDSPREASRSRSKSKERPSTAMALTHGPSAGPGTGSQNVTPSKQKSVLAIFKPGKRGSSAGTDATKSSKSSSPIDCAEPPPPPPPAPGSGGRNRTPAGSRPNSRLRYYDEPVEGYIHIPLHTPPEEREARTLLQEIQQLVAPSPPPMERPRILGAVTSATMPAPAGAGAPITASQLAAAAAALRPVGQRKPEAARPRADLDAIQTLPSQEELEARETLHSVSAVLSARAANLGQVAEHRSGNGVRENGLAEMQRLPSVDSTQSACEPRLVQTVATVNVPTEDSAAAKERRRLLFATRLGSGSQEQLFSTQFSISKTESQSSQLSEQVQPPDSGSTASDCTTDGLQRQGTVIRRTDATAQPTAPSSSEEEQPPAAIVVSAAVVMRSKHKSCSNSEEEAAPTTTPTPTPTAPAAAPAADVRHSRYLESFDVRKKYHENVTENVTGNVTGSVTGTVPRKPKRQTVSEAKSKYINQSLTYACKTIPPVWLAMSYIRVLSNSESPYSNFLASAAALPEPETEPEPELKPELAMKPEPRELYELEALSPPPPGERSERHSTDEHEPIESSESERDSDMAGSSSMATAVPMGADAKRHHFPRNVCVIEEHESTGLVSQESFDDELPYVPTTLPEERAQGVPLIPMKERANMELKTCPVDRPRSTTPLNPSHLEEYCTGIMTPQEPPHASHELDPGFAGPVRGEKLRISLPRKDTAVKDKGQSTKSPRRISNASGKSWFEFAEEGLRANHNLERKDSNKQLLPATPPAQGQGQCQSQAPSMPASLEEPKPKASTQRKLSGHWIDFENIPEKRKTAKRITTLPKETITTTTTTAITSASSASGCASAHRSSSGHPHAHHGHGHGHHHHHHQQQQQPSRQDAASGDKLHYNYVKPEDCQCECHEAERGESSAATATATTTSNTADKEKDVSTGTGTGTGTGSDSLASVELLQQGEDMLPLIEPEVSAETRIYSNEPLPPPARHSSKSTGQRMEEFPRRDAASSSRNRKFPDRKVAKKFVQ
ncbi:flocculation protein FLO11 [Drosophila novamexicana]|uniref:flocculation protein FLO11 n=1 Tax=Drosophila novamexicana TaxID=47314 RepID=UPI0011E5890A|nr:flocculation protein FLO11 [Drosophila novamexicana]